MMSKEEKCMRAMEEKIKQLQAENKELKAFHEMANKMYPKQIPVGGRVVKDISKFPKELRYREA